MKDARGLDVTGNDAAAVAAAGDFAARLLRLDQGVEAILDAAKRWPDTPSDLLTAKIAEFLYYVLGQQYMGPRFRAHMRRLEGAAHAGDPDFLAMAAFASELCGDYVAAEALAERALGIEPRNPWAQHALSHVLIRQGRV